MIHLPLLCRYPDESRHQATPCSLSIKGPPRALCNPIVWIFPADRLGKDSAGVHGLRVGNPLEVGFDEGINTLTTSPTLDGSFHTSCPPPSPNHLAYPREIAPLGASIPCWAGAVSWQCIPTSRIMVLSIHPSPPVAWCLTFPPDCDSKEKHLFPQTLYPWVGHPLIMMSIVNSKWLTTHTELQNK